MHSKPSPLILHIPHSSLFIPDEEISSFTLSNHEIIIELLKMTDLFTDELFDIKNQKISRVVFPVSRILVDPERFLDDDQEPMAKRGMGVPFLFFQ